MTNDNRISEGNKDASLLIIDDEEDMREMLSYDLSSQSYKVLAVSGGKEAVEAIRLSSYDVAVTDLRMPGMNGIETLKAIKTIDPEMEVIIETAYSSIETAAECMTEGAFSYIQKPYNISDIQMLVRKGVRKARANRIVGLRRTFDEMTRDMQCSNQLKSVMETFAKVLKADVSACYAKCLKSDKTVVSSRNGGEGISLKKIKADPAFQCPIESGIKRFPSLEIPNPPDCLKGSVFGSYISTVVKTCSYCEVTLFCLRKNSSAAFTPDDERLFAIMLPQVSLSAQIRVMRKRM